jgi:catechol 2,3-dioxygenase-like lactoylglutathione lyase family enzyme
MLRRFNHVGYRCRDAAATVEFYTKGLGLAWKGATWAEAVPSIGLHSPHIHLIFQLDDGTTIDLFEVLDGEARTVPVENDFAQHLALEADNEDQALAIVARLQAMGVEVTGRVDHPLGRSWYLHDPSGHRVEIALKAPPEAQQAVWNRIGETASADLARWEARKHSPAKETTA